MGECLNCGGHTYKKNKTGYCTRTRACARLSESVRRYGDTTGVGKGRYERDKTGWPPCLNCGTGTRNATGYCTTAVECVSLGYARVRYLALVAYGGPICVCCGETRFERLSLDHVNGDGYLDRRKTKGGGSGANYRALYSAGFPDKHRYQVLCHNCNMEKGVGVACPCPQTSILVKLREQGAI